MDMRKNHDRKIFVVAKNGMVASSQPLATLAGVQILMNGGNAIDAAVATAAVLGVVEPSSIGIGGDAFCLFYSAKEKSLKALDASGRSPYAASLEFCRKSGFKEMPQRGIHSVTVPGAVHGWTTLLNSYGTKTLRDVLRSAIRHAEEGFPVAELTAESWNESEARLKADEGATINYLDRWPHAQGRRDFQESAHGEDATRIAAEGADVFLPRATSPRRLCAVRKNWADFLRSKTLPIIVRIGWSRSPPTIAAMISTRCRRPRRDLSRWRCSRFSKASISKRGPQKRRRAAFDDRGEEACVCRSRSTSRGSRFHESVGERICCAQARVEKLRAQIQQDRAAVTTQSISAGTDTEYVAAADSDGNLVSFIQSNFMGFGSGVVEPETGIILQNRGHLFSLDENHPNCIGPHKRCVHTLMPG